MVRKPRSRSDDRDPNWIRLTPITTTDNEDFQGFPTGLTNRTGRGSGVNVLDFKTLPYGFKRNLVLGRPGIVAVPLERIRCIPTSKQGGYVGRNGYDGGLSLPWETF